MIVTVPPVADDVRANASDEADMGPETCTCELVSVVELEMTSDTMAATPSAIAILLSPQSTHVVEPTLGLQEMDLLDAVATGPVATVAEEKSTPG
jgi:hypothetical protein